MKKIWRFTWSLLLSVIAASPALANPKLPEQTDAGNFWNLAPIVLKTTYGDDVANYPKQVLRHVVFMKEADATMNTNLRDEFARQELLDPYILKGRRYLGEMLSKTNPDILWMRTKLVICDYDFERQVYPLSLSDYCSDSEIESLSYTIEASSKEKSASRAMTETLERPLNYAGKTYYNTEDFFNTTIRLKVIPRQLGLKLSREQAQAFRTKYNLGDHLKKFGFVFVSYFKPKVQIKNNQGEASVVVDLEKVEFYQDKKAFDAGQPAATFTPL